MSFFAPTVAVFPFAGVAPEVIRELGRAVIEPGKERTFGKSEERELGYFAGRAALALLFRQRGLRAVVRANRPYGYLGAFGPGVDGCFVNLSHTHGIAVAVLAASSVGIDVERVDRNPGKALQRVASKEMQTWVTGRELDVPGGKIPAPIALWCAKEAFSKATGLGLKFGLIDFAVDLAGTSPYPAQTRRTGPLAVLHPAVRFFRYGDFSIALCGERKALESPISLETVPTFL